jgi:hypothetical protein
VSPARAGKIPPKKRDADLPALLRVPINRVRAASSINPSLLILTISRRKSSFTAALSASLSHQILLL